MSNTVTHHVNKTQGEEHSLPCTKCTGKTAHKVLASLDIRGNETDGEFSFSWADDNQIIQCLGCKTVSFRTARSNSEDGFHINEHQYECNINEALYPARIEGIKGLGDETRYLPTTVRRIYDETLMALSIQAPVLAGIGLRALLETVCKEKKAKGDNLLKKIDSLVEVGILTPSSASILHKIRALGNDAAHEMKPHSDKQLSLALDIVQHLLKDVYIFSKQVETEFDD